MASTCSAASTGSSASPSWHASTTKSTDDGSRTCTTSLSTRRGKVAAGSSPRRSATASVCVVVVPAT